MPEEYDDITIPWWALVLFVIVLFGGIGYFVSPLDAGGHPIFLAPDVKAIYDYRASVLSWSARLTAIDAETSSILSGAFGSDLFLKSQRSERNLEAAYRITQEIELTDAPSSSAPVRELTLTTSYAYLTAARDALIWAGAPNEENKATADTTLQVARTNLTELKNMEWLK